MSSSQIFLVYVIMTNFNFLIQKKIPNSLGRAGVLKTQNGDIETPAFVSVGTKATVKALSPEQVASLGAQVVLANTYHLYLQPGDSVIKKAGGLGKFMNWNGPTMTDSGGFQAFSLGEAFGSSVGKIAKEKNSKIKTETEGKIENKTKASLAKISEDGVTFKSHIDGSEHLFTPEKSIEIQHNIGADIIFAFDECTSPQASYEYQKEAMNRTHRWANRSFVRHKELLKKRKTTEEYCSLFGIVQGGRYEDLRKESALFMAELETKTGGFDGFGIGGSFDKEDMNTVVGWVNKILPEEKPRHLLGIGGPLDLFGAVENGSDLFDCVAPTRIGRNGMLYTNKGKINILNARFKNDHTPIEKNCDCYTCKNYTRSYVAHLFRAKEMFAATLASIHNLYFIINLVKKMRQSITENQFSEYKKSFFAEYKD